MATDIDRLLLRNGPVEAWLSNRRGHSIPHEPTVVFSKDTRKVSTAVPVKPATPYRLQWRSLQGHPVTAMATVVLASADVDTTDENAQVEPRKFFMVQTDPETQTCASHTTKRNAQWFHTPSEAGEFLRGSVQLRIYMGREQSDTSSLVSADADSDPPADSEPLVFQFTFIPQPSPPPSPPRNKGKRRRGSPPAPTAKAPKGKKQKLATKTGTGKRKKKVEEQTAEARNEAEAGPSTAQAVRPTKEQLPNRDVDVEEKSKGTKSGRKSKRKSKEKTT
ncbi:hypothetical protein HMN09_00109500 [Mycena chlorophos]|uniref:Uncharacterized protein n=1 Tax=Mycena chlorophos TaxID=658473 RepID=A0A8H6TUY4_MYCCL|nr:hypothetical protein HMN09_00109500 [Mycena chlorophos]